MLLVNYSVKCTVLQSCIYLSSTLEKVEEWNKVPRTYEWQSGDTVFFDFALFAGNTNETDYRLYVFIKLFQMIGLLLKAR